MTKPIAISLRGLRTFVQAAQYGSFSQAAEVLFITPSAVSHQIRGLEARLGHKLFERQGNELRLTGTGREMFNDIQPLMSELESVVANYTTRTSRQRIRMSVQPFFASEYFLPRLGEFTDQHPDVDIQVSASDESAETLPPDVDLSIRLFRKPPKGYQSRLLFPLRFAPAGSKAMAKSIKVKDGLITSELPLIVHQSYPRAWQQWSKAAGVQLPRDSKVTQLDSMITVVRATEQGIGASLVPVPIADQWFHQKTIVRLFDEELTANVSYYLLWRDDQELAADGVLLRQWIESRFTTSA
ncbi:MAG: LysR substrate-binding domain-containing protein [Pseudomonadota bacterium]